LKYAIMLNGVTQLIMMKSDVLSGFDTIKVCTHYKYKGQITERVPYDVVNEKIEPVYVDLPGWKEDLMKVSEMDHLPATLMQYVDYIEQATGLPITIISVGPDRKQTLMRKEVAF
jgi:adenylosuccinate synthase